jgi:DMSO reductase anchor subunit
MELALQELPLAIFTTLAPIGAGAFVLLALAFALKEFSAEQLKKIDKLTAIPLILVIIGFAAAFIHLADPLHAPWALSGIGSSPLSNEIAVGSLFVVVSVVYWVLACMGKLDNGARKPYAIVLAVVAVIFACFTGLAYYVDTIASWATIALPVSIIGFSLAGGALLGSLIVSCAVGDGGGLSKIGKSAIILIMIGAVLGIIGACGQYAVAAGILTPMTNGAAMASAVTGYLVAAIVLIVLGAAAGIYALAKGFKTGMLASGFILIIVAVFIARLVFYALRISVGL